MTAPPRDRIAAMVCTAIVVGLLGYALVVGLAMRRPVVTDSALQTFGVAPPPPPPPPVPERHRSPRKEGAASPANLKAKASAIVAPKPIVPPPDPPPLPAAPIAGVGNAPSAGAAPVPGPGTGAGGVGTGTGSGGRGDGDGGGGAERPPKRIKGDIRYADYPLAAKLANAGGTVLVKFAVETDGRATGCTILRSSGRADLDETTCRLIEQRFRYRPWIDGNGRPVRAFVTREQDWIVDN